MQVTFYGVRGSIPAPGPDFARYGGNTACVHVKLNCGTDLILDSGSGIKKLGQHLFRQKGDIYILLSHNHWDHIQGFPFFEPAYQQKRRIFITPGLTKPYEPEAILLQMSGTWFPVSPSDLLADIEFVNTNRSISSWQIGDAKITRTVMNHPGGGSAYLIEEDDKTLAYVTDNELYPPYHCETSFEQWLSFVDGADLLIHDAQYIKGDMPHKLGWGHSIVEQAIELAEQSNVKKCALYSHDHIRTDDMIDQLTDELKRKLVQKSSKLELFSAYEGLSITL